MLPYQDKLLVNEFIKQSFLHKGLSSKNLTRFAEYIMRNRFQKVNKTNIFIVYYMVLYFINSSVSLVSMW